MQWIALILTQIATVALCLCMRRHRTLIGGRELSIGVRWSVRSVAFLVLLLAQLILLRELATLPALALFFGWFTAAMLLVVACVTWKEARSRRS
ncbi:MAG: DUF3325 family protein [Pseudomonadota bacterium]